MPKGKLWRQKSQARCVHVVLSLDRGKCICESGCAFEFMSYYRLSISANPFDVLSRAKCFRRFFDVLPPTRLPKAKALCVCPRAFSLSVCQIYPPHHHHRVPTPVEAQTDTYRPQVCSARHRQKLLPLSLSQIVKKMRKRSSRISRSGWREVRPPLELILCP